jgi:hypothetical protein
MKRVFLVAIALGATLVMLCLPALAWADSTSSTAMGQSTSAQADKNKTAPKKETAKPEPNSTLTLMTLTPQVSQGSLLVISSNVNNTFDVQPGNNDVVFKIPSKGEQNTKTTPAQSVTPDGRVICVKVPYNALPGEVAARNQEKVIGKVTFSITDSTRRTGLFMAIWPALLYLVSLVVVVYFLKKSKWSLAEALSENDALRDNAGSIINDKDGMPIFPKSASRMLAFIGLMCIITWLIGLSVPTIFRYACTGEVHDLSGVSSFLLAQAGVFSPYIVNKIASALK